MGLGFRLYSVVSWLAFVLVGSGNQGNTLLTSILALSNITISGWTASVGLE